MKVLILSANTGQGHNSCAQAIREVCLQHGDECDIEDVFGLISHRLSRSIARNHEKTYRQKPKKSDRGYQFLLRHPGMFDRKKPVYRMMSLGRRRISRCVLQGGYDTVVCTHALAAVILTSAIEQEGLKVRSAFVATDHSCSPGVSGSRLDGYFIPHADLADEFVQAGVPWQRITATGIPVRQSFCQKADAVQARQALGLAPEKRHLLMMCGSMGCGPIPQLLSLIAARMPQNWQITVVCGTNEALREQLLEEHGTNAAIHIRGYEQQMPLLLQSADLYLTKPGGLSTAEAAAAAVPMALIDAVAGCEENNLRHFVSIGAAVAGTKAQEAAEACLELMNDADRLTAMAEALRKEDAAQAAERIWQALTNIKKEPV